MKAWFLIAVAVLASVIAGPAASADDFIVLGTERMGSEAPSGGAAARGAAGAEKEEEGGGWTWERVTYGPLELCAAGLMPVVGIFVGGTIGTLVPMKGMHPYCKVLAPYMAVGGGAVGATAGAILAPIIVVEGLFDTLTGGAFAERPFAWFNVKVPLNGDFDMSVLENAALEQAEEGK
ncbi:MAG: hypothetical protein N2595_07255 [bacterium]|nr:hypothetical protein [bacterium]